jgi:ADP-ribosylglycohydrolase
MTTPATDQAHGALLGLALGDALGMPTQSMSRTEIHERYGRISGLVDAVPDQPIAPSMPAGSVTDDTEQAVILAQLLIEGRGHVAPLALADALLEWEQSMIRRGSLDLLGPSTRLALRNLQDGMSPEETGRTGITNGAAMRIAPIGIAYPPGPGLERAVVEAGRVTHDTGLGISGATAVATAVSSGIEGSGLRETVDRAADAARRGETRGHWVAGASIASRLAEFRPVTRKLKDSAFDTFLYEVVGTSVQSQESVVSALLIVEHDRDDPWKALTRAASLGGDTDTIAAMAGAVLGAAYGARALPEAPARRVESFNGLGLGPLAEQLISLRDEVVLHD